MIKRLWQMVEDHQVYGITDYELRGFHRLIAQLEHDLYENLSRQESVPAVRELEYIRDALNDLNIVE